MTTEIYAKCRMLESFYRQEPGAPSAVIHAAQWKKYPQAGPSLVACKDDFKRYYTEWVDDQLRTLDNRIWGKDCMFPVVGAPFFGNGWISTAFGGRYDMEQDWTHPSIHSADELRSIIKNPGMGDGLVGAVLDGLDYTVRRLDKSLPVRMPTAFLSPLSVASMAVDGEVLMEALYTHPQEMHDLLNIITDYTIELITLVRSRVPDLVDIGEGGNVLYCGPGVFISGDWASVVSPWLYRDFELPCLQRIAERFGGYMVHACGNISINFDNLKSSPLCKGVEFGVTESSLEKAVSAFGTSKILGVHLGLNSEPTYKSRYDYVSAVLAQNARRSPMWITANSGPCWPAESEYNDESDRIIELVAEYNRTSIGK